MNGCQQMDRENHSPAGKSRSSVGRNMLIRESQGDILLLDSDILYIPGSFAYLKKSCRVPAGNWRNWFQSMVMHL